MYKRQHPITILLELKLSNLYPIIFLAIFSGDMGIFRFLLPLGFFVIALIFVAVSWYFKVYWVENNILHIKQGIFTKKESYLNKERVQTIQTSSNIFYQLLGLTRLKIETAGGGSEPEVNLAGIRVEEAKELIALLNEDVSEAEQMDEALAETTTKEEKPSTVYKLTWNEILLASVTSGEIGLLFSLLFVVWSQVNDYIPNWIIEKAESYIMGHDIYGWMLIGGVLLVLSWILSTIRYAMKHANFTVYRKNDEIRIAQGLYEKKEIALKLHRIQGITIKEGLFRQPFGYCTVNVEVIQSVGEEGGQEKVVLHPLIQKDRVGELLSYLELPYAVPEQLTALPKTALRRYIIESMIYFGILAVPVAGALVYFEKYMFTFALLPLLLLFIAIGYAQYRAAGYKVNGDQLAIIYRNIAKYTGLVRRRHIQSLEKQQSYFQRKDQLCTYTFYSAASHYKLEHTRLEDAENMYNWYKNKEITLS
ncbi:membrane protein [Bacillus manliponensis]|uniref:Membrane protein n=1 Tax=Bacillus manliponensis TaxID=574376 RepID=A0A073K0U7_9BACI|nr:PH domain-containing protein [Bacillus manliponensis]KEK20130.1 membrane protein [Bacillus manliponensis]